MGPAILFCPADRPERFRKAAERADAVILDLEDAVASAARPAAREALVAHSLDPARTIVRINPPGTPDFVADIAALSRTGYRTVMVAKAENASEFEALDGYQVIALCETAKGVLAAESIARHHSVVALMWGAEDLAASLGGTSSRHPDGSYRDVARHARSRVLLAARAHGKAGIDSVFLDIKNTTALTAEV
ncbi:MAG TPA: aldolase/citrate lyase family protein, partial [Terrimesophilobacter sp.]|nr:aldolase/citrate lyase family protein [Terrimesophilobacter sp.]